MSPARIIWIVWCLVWVLVWLVLAGHDAVAWSDCQQLAAQIGGGMVSCAGAPVWGPLVWLALAAGSAAAIWLPVGKPRQR